MYYFELGIFMEVLQASSDSIYDLVPLDPIKLLAFLSVYATFMSSKSRSSTEHSRENGAEINIKIIFL